MQKPEIRLQKFLAEAGIDSRRKCEKLILNGRVSVNGRIVTELGFKVSESDIVELDGKRVRPEGKKVYIMFHKPAGYVTTVKDQFSRKTVLDLIEGVEERIFPVGRLDYDTSGLLLLTNDGELANKLTHPKYEIDKVYLAKIKGEIDYNVIRAFEEGMEIDGDITAPARIRTVEKYEKNSLVEITIHEGRNRQVRKMLEKSGHDVIRLKRAAFGPLMLDDLKEGHWRHLRPEEVRSLIKGEVF
jgi:23S rRNA pseudouridine2605 synthase